MGIGELAARSGLRPSALRHYETLGLLEPARDGAGRRRYDPSALDLLRFVAACKRAGFGLGEIAELLAADDRHRRFRRAAKRKLDELDRRAAEIEATRRRLAHAIDCRCADLGNCALVADRAG